MSESNDEILSVGPPLPRVAAVAPAENYKVDVVWATGEQDRVDLATDIFTFKIYAPLRHDPALFGTVHLIADGNAIGWGADDPIDMPATAIERLSREVMTPADLRAFMKTHRLTRDGLAAQLGISRRLVGYYLRERQIPRYIALACTALTQRLSAAL